MPGKLARPVWREAVRKGPTNYGNLAVRPTQPFTASAIVDKYAVPPDHADGGTSIRRCATR